MAQYTSNTVCVYIFIPIFLCVCLIGIQARQIEKEGYAMKLEIKSTAFKEGETIPQNIPAMGLIFRHHYHGHSLRKGQRVLY